ncbi:MAG: ABC transporter ATP-binding protein [Gammaproteobacteria bacterium]|nr:ABC transporter ATP-binding protein [Gammaproteobacteria bacterium]
MNAQHGMAQLTIDQLNVGYGDSLIVKAASFSLKQGEIGSLLGPSGCGKTTLLRAIAGFEIPSSGMVLIGGVRVNTPNFVVPPEQREIGMVFQEHALFPHLTVADNIGFGLSRWSRSKRNRRVIELLEMIGLAGSGNSYPHQLSGGQQQRIALARALAPKPKLLLLDEPFSNLDVELRTSLARELREILKQEQTTALLVTHDQNEAFAMADQIGVINQGRIEQWDSAYNLYHAPKTRFVADFIGEGILLPGKLNQQHRVTTEIGSAATSISSTVDGEQVEVLVRPDDILLGENRDTDIYAEIIDRAFRGAEYLYTLKLQSGQKLLALCGSHRDYVIGDNISVALDEVTLPIFEVGV